MGPVRERESSSDAPTPDLPQTVLCGGLCGAVWPYGYFPTHLVFGLAMPPDPRPPLIVVRERYDGSIRLALWGSVPPMGGRGVGAAASTSDAGR